MPFRVLKFQDTPNPNAVKCILDRSPGPVPRSYLNAAAAAGDALATSLFAIPGVSSVLISDGWLTVNKAPSAPWGPIRSGVERALHEAEG